MRTSHYLLIFIVIIIPFILLVFTTTNINVTISQEDENIREILYTGTEDALVNVLESQNYSYNKEKLWTEESIQKALDSLNNHFENRLNYDINSVIDTTDYLFPLVCFMDYDGYYIRYIGNEYDGSAEDKKVNTGLNTWTRLMESKNKTYNVMYYLGKNYLTVTNADGVTFSGTYDEVDEFFSGLTFLPKKQINLNGELKNCVDAETFNKERDAYIAEKTQEMLNYYLNNKDVTINKLGKNMYVTFNYEDNEMHQMFHNVGIITFLQGPTFNNAYDKTPICAYAHYEKVKTKPCTITMDGKTLYYHNENCSQATLQNFYSTVNNAEEAVYMGASPCIHCY